MLVEWTPDGMSPVDVTAAIKLAISLEMPLSERATARLRLKNQLPERTVDTFTIYHKDNLTKLFEGLVLNRRVLSQAPHALPYYCDVTVGDYSTYADWCYQSKVYATDPTVKEVLEDLVSDKLGAYGITIHPGQVDGPTLAAFTWVDKRVSDGLREIRDKTGYAFRVDADKQLRMFLPGTDPAPYTVTDATPNVQDIEWDDSTEVPANTVILRCGPDGPGEVEKRWIQAGGATSWVADIPAAHGGGTAGYVTVDGVFKTLSPSGEGGQFYWDADTSTLSVGTDPTPADGVLIVLVYTGQFPFSVEATSGATPRIEVIYRQPTETHYDAAVELAAGLLDQIDQIPRTLTMPSSKDGWLPGQAVSVVSATRDVSDADATITNVQIEMVSGSYWRYLLTVQETTVPQASYLDQWRELIGQGGASAGSGGTVISGGLTTTVILATPFPLGGSRVSSDIVGTDRAPVINWLPFVVTSHLSARIRVTCRARHAGVEVTPSLTKYNTGTMDWDVFATGAGVTSVAEVEQEILTVLSPGTYRLEHVTDTAGDSGDAYSIGQAERVAA